MWTSDGEIYFATEDDVKAGEESDKYWRDFDGPGMPFGEIVREWQELKDSSDPECIYPLKPPPNAGLIPVFYGESDLWQVGGAVYFTTEDDDYDAAEKNRSYWANWQGVSVNMEHLVSEWRTLKVSGQARAQRRF